MEIAMEQLRIDSKSFFLEIKKVQEIDTTIVKDYQKIKKDFNHFVKNGIQKETKIKKLWK
jgi:phosphopantetheine adenylyltransferase